MAKKTDDIENLISFTIKDNYVRANELSYYFYRFYPPNISILTDKEIDIEISSLCHFLESANMPIQIFAMDKVEDLSRNKNFFENMSEKYKKYTEQIVAQISSHDTNDRNTNSIQRAYYFVICSKSENNKNNFEIAFRTNNLKCNIVERDELITIFRNYLLREFSSFNMYEFGKELKIVYDNTTKRT